jgi:hypothetical protein
MATRRSFKFSKLRELHAQIGALIQESDDKLAGVDNALGGDPLPQSDQTSANPAASLKAGAALDAAPMSQAFPGFSMNGPLHKPKR